MNDVLTVEELAALVQIHPVTAREMAKSGAIPARKVGRVWRFSRQAVLKWLSNDERVMQWQSEKIPKQEFGTSTYQLVAHPDTKNLASQRTKSKRKNFTTK